jgi:hypothetical protein
LKKRTGFKGKSIILFGALLTVILVFGFIAPLFVEEAIDLNYWTNGEKLTQADLDAFNFLRLNTPSNYSVLTFSATSNLRMSSYVGLSSMQNRINRDPDVFFTPIFAETSLYSLMMSQVKYLYMSADDMAELKQSSTFSGFVKDSLLRCLPVVFHNEKAVIFEVPRISLPDTSSDVGLITSDLNTGYFRDFFDQSNNLNFRQSFTVSYGDVLTIKNDNNGGNHYVELPLSVDPKEYPYVIIRWKTDGSRLDFYFKTAQNTYYTLGGSSTNWQISIINLNNFFDYILGNNTYIKSNEQLDSLIFFDSQANASFSIDYIQIAGLAFGNPLEQLLALNVLGGSQIKYSLVLNDAPDRFGYKTLILTHDLNQLDESDTQGLQEYIDWIRGGGHLIILDSQGHYVSYEDSNLTYSDYFGWSEETFLTGWTVKNCISSTDGNIVTIKNNALSAPYYDFISPDLNVSVNSYPYVVIRWKTDGSNLLFYPQGNQTGFLYVKLGASTEWTTSVINLRDFYDYVAKNITSFQDNESIDKFLFRSETGNATYSIGYVKFYRMYPLPRPFFADQLSIYTNGVAQADGLQGQVNYFALPYTIDIPLINSNDPNVTVVANYTLHNGSVSPYAVSKTIGKGQITYVASSPFFSIVANKTGTILSSFLKNTGNLINVLNLASQKNIINYSNYFPEINYAKGDITLMGKIKLSSDYIQIPEINITGITFTSSNGTLMKTVALSNSSVKKVEYIGPVKFELMASKVDLSGISLGSYSIVKMLGDFNLTIKVPTNGVVNFMIDIDGVSHNETYKGGTIELYFNNGYKSFVTSKSPTFNTDGNSSFASGRIYRSQYKMPLFYADGLNPFRVEGETVFNIKYSDNGVFFFNNFTFNGALSIQSAAQIEPNLTENDIPWFSVMTSPFNLMLIVGVLTFFVGGVIYRYFSKKSSAKFCSS